MTQYNITLDSEDVQGLFSSDDGMAVLMEQVVNQILDQQATEQIGADKYERTDGRIGYRAGYRPRMLKTRIGRLELLVPRLRNGRFSTELYSRLQRSEQALLPALMEMVINGVSTRKVSRVVEEMCGMEFPSSSVSDLCKRLDPIVISWNERRLDECLYPFLVLDAIYIEIREVGRVRSYAVLLGTGVRDDGHREILGLQISQTESELSWKGYIRWLCDQDLSGVDLVISDNHKGLVKAIRSQLPGSSWQHCQTHLTRNILDSTPKRLRRELHSRLRLVFESPDENTARKLADEMIERYSSAAPKAIVKLEEHLADALAVVGLPEKYRKRLRISNSIERLNQEIRRRERVIRIFPNQGSVLRLIGALLEEQDEVWTEGKKYLDMREFQEWMETIKQPEERENRVLEGVYEFAH